jgi:hypothetical protein
MAEPEETYSTSEHLYTELDIPRGVTGTLPRAMRERAGLEAEAIEDIGETGRIRTPRPSKRSKSPGRRGSGQDSSGSGSGQARKSGRETADATQAAEVTRSRRRRRTRGGREVAADQSGQADQGEARRKAS